MDENIYELKKKTVSGVFWRFGERILAQLVSFIVSVVLARILIPEQYGIIAIVTIFINIANVFVTSGLGTSLVQKKDADELDFSTMFYASLLLSIVVYVSLFFLAPILAKLYENELLTVVIRVMGIKLPIAAINSIQQAYVSNKMIYKKFFLATLIGTIISAFIGVGMALSNFGVWALVAQYLSNSLIDTIVLFFTVKWRPTLSFSMKRFKVLFSYGWKVMATSLIGTIFDQVRGLIIGVKYTSEDLAYCSKGEQIPAIISGNINSVTESVIFSSISKVQKDIDKVKRAVSRLLKTSSYIIMPLLLGVSAVAEILVEVLLTDKWMFCIPYLRIVCVQQCFSILNLVNLQAIKAIGRSDVLLKLEFIKKPIYVIILLISMNISPLAICAGNAIYALIALLINSYPNKKLLNYSLIEQIKDVGGYMLLALIMQLIVWRIGYIEINNYLLLVIQILIGVIFYIGVSKYLKLDSFEYMFNLLKDMLNKKRGKKNG